MTLSKIEKVELLMESFNIFKNKILQGNVDLDDMANRINESM